MKKTCINCKYRDMDYSSEYPCCECANKSRWEQWQDTNYQPTVEDLIILELEKLKEKINSEDVDCQYEEDYVYSSGLQKAIELIDNRIEELKGE